MCNPHLCFQNFLITPDRNCPEHTVTFHFFPLPLLPPVVSSPCDLLLHSAAGVIFLRHDSDFCPAQLTTLSWFLLELWVLSLSWPTVPSLSQGPPDYRLWLCHSPFCLLNLRFQALSCLRVFACAVPSSRDPVPSDPPVAASCLAGLSTALVLRKASPLGACMLCVVAAPSLLCHIPDGFSHRSGTWLGIILFVWFLFIFCLLKKNCSLPWAETFWTCHSSSLSA